MWQAVIVEEAFCFPFDWNFKFNHIGFQTKLVFYVGQIYKVQEESYLLYKGGPKNILVARFLCSEATQNMHELVCDIEPQGVMKLHKYVGNYVSSCI